MQVILSFTDMGYIDKNDISTWTRIHILHTTEELPTPLHVLNDFANKYLQFLNPDDYEPHIIGEEYTNIYEAIKYYQDLDYYFAIHVTP